MNAVRIYMTASCAYCQMATRLLDKKGVAVEKIRVDLEPERRKEMIQLSGRTSVPQIFIGERHVGGYTDLAELDMEGELDPLLATVD
jgi:glutaredoxin 3